MLQQIMMMVEMMKAKAALQQQVSTVNKVIFMDKDDDGKAEWFDILGYGECRRIRYKDYELNDSRSIFLYDCVKDIARYYTQYKNEEIFYDERSGIAWLKCGEIDIAFD